MSDSFCILPYNHVSIDPTGQIRPCCNYNYQHKDFPMGNKFPNILDIQDPNNFMEGPIHTWLKKDIESNKRHKFCNRCWMSEDGGSGSYRTTWNEIFKDSKPEIKIEYLELTLGNKCNIKCRMCNPWSSSLWAEDISKHPELNYWKTNMSEHNFEYYDTPQFNIFLDNILPTIKRINLLGGEPLIIDKYYEILERIIKLDRADQVSIQFNTNLLSLQNKNLVLWKKFKGITANLSCDGINELNEYIRYPGKWSVWIRNLKKIIEWKKELGSKLYLSIHSTLSSLTYMQMDKIYKWVYESDIEVKLPFVIYVNQPLYMDPIHLPDKIKQEGLKKQLAILDNMSLDVSSITSLLKYIIEQPRDQLQWDEFILHTKNLDAVRNQNILDYIPEFTEYWHD